MKKIYITYSIPAHFLQKEKLLKLFSSSNYIDFYILFWSRKAYSIFSCKMHFNKLVIFFEQCIFSCTKIFTKITVFKSANNMMLLVLGTSILSFLDISRTLEHLQHSCRMTSSSSDSTPCPLTGCLLWAVQIGPAISCVIPKCLRLWKSLFRLS